MEAMKGSAAPHMIPPLEQAKHCIGFITRFAMVTASRSGSVGRQQEPPLGALLQAADVGSEKSYTVWPQLKNVREKQHITT
jgi:hypothetical protein